MRSVGMALACMMVAASASAVEPGFDTFICHRGESVDAPENTLPAYRLAVNRGFGFECDIYLSNDGRCFTFHDSNLTRTSGGANTNSCWNASWETDVSKLDVGGWGKWKGSKFEGTRPALLEEVLELARDGRWIYVEIKAGREIVPHLKTILARQKKATPKNVLFICFYDSVCAELKRQMPEYKVLWLSRARHKGDNTVVAAEEAIKKAKACGADGVDICFDADIHTADYIRKVRSAGLEFHVWVVDHAVKSMLAFCRGAQTVTTNRAKAQLDEIEKESHKPW